LHGELAELSGIGAAKRLATYEIRETDGRWTLQVREAVAVYEHSWSFVLSMGNCSSVRCLGLSMARRWNAVTGSFPLLTNS